MSAIKRLLTQAGDIQYQIQDQLPYAQAADPSFDDPRFASEKIQEIAQQLLQALEATKAGNPQVDLRQSYVIDPVKVAGELSRGKPGSLQYQADQMAAQVFLLEQLLAERQMRQFNQGSGPLPEAFALQVSPDVVYKRQVKADRTGASNPTPVEFANFANTPMMDWDFPDPSHPDAAVTIRNLGDVEDAIREYQRGVPESNISLYQTPGGYRAFELGQEMPVTKFQGAYRQMNVDPLYARFNMTGGKVGHVLEHPGYRSRLSHKPGRTDWVALKIADFEGSDPQMSPRSQKIVNVMHDRPIQEAYLNNPETMQAAARAVQANLPSASNALQKEIARRMRF